MTNALEGGMWIPIHGSKNNPEFQVPHLITLIKA